MLVSEIFQTGKGACASMPILYAALCEYMGLSVSVVTIGDHCFGRYYENNTWVNIELTVDGRTGVGVPDAAYLKDFTDDNQAYQQAVESGLDMRQLSLDEMTGLMYANKTSYLYKKYGYRNIDALYKAASFGVAYNPVNWMHAENWKKVRNVAIDKEEEQQIKDIKAELVKLGVKSNGSLDSITAFNSETHNQQQKAWNPSNPFPKAQYNSFGSPERESVMNPFGDTHVEAEHLKHVIKKAERGYGISQDKQNLQAMKNRLRLLQDPTFIGNSFGNIEMPIHRERRKRKEKRIKTLKSNLKTLEEKRKVSDRNSDARKQIELLRIKK
jgi:hypothetical protein